MNNLKHNPIAAETSPRVIIILPIGFAHKLVKKLVDISTIPVIVVPASVKMLLDVITSASANIQYHLSML